ncbi:MAG: MGMT family protein [Deltaproteobacteria bacterium]|nr:MAG: MGMT family protein [Deltaproteobacteria bacterium]
MSDDPPKPVHRRIHDVVRRIPRGRVATYGQIAALARLPRQPRLVGYALHALPNGSDVPWQRVINARGEVSPRAQPGADALQRQLLEAEGVTFDGRGRVDLSRHGWRPRSPRGSGSGRLG